MVRGRLIIGELEMINQNAQLNHLHYFSEGIPKQRNAYDCGVFLCMFLQLISANQVCQD